MARPSGPAIDSNCQPDANLLSIRQRRAYISPESSAQPSQQEAQEWMTAKPEAAPDATLAGNPISPGLRIAAIVLRSIFVGALLVVTIRVAAPQSETIWSVFDTPGDLIRVILGLIAGIGSWRICSCFLRIPRAIGSGFILALLSRRSRSPAPSRFGEVRARSSRRRPP